MPTCNPPRAGHASPPASTEADTSASFSTTFASAVHLLRVATVLVALLACAAFPRSAFFPIRAIIVEGTQQVPDDEVIARAQLHVDDARFAVASSEVAARVMRHPRIESADVQLTADGAVRISVVERVPFVVARLAGTDYLIDRSGIVLARQQDPTALSTLTIERGELAKPQLGMPIPSSDGLHALEVLQTLPQSVIGSEVRIKVAANGDLTLITGDGIAILLGQPRGLHERAAPLETVIAAVRGTRGTIDYIDLRYAGTIIVKPASKGPRGGVRP